MEGTLTPNVAARQGCDTHQAHPAPIRYNTEGEGFSCLVPCGWRERMMGADRVSEQEEASVVWVSWGAEIHAEQAKPAYSGATAALIGMAEFKIRVNCNSDPGHR